MEAKVTGNAAVTVAGWIEEYSNRYGAGVALNGEAVTFSSHDLAIDFIAFLYGKVEAAEEGGPEMEPEEATLVDRLATMIDPSLAREVVL